MPAEDSEKLSGAVGGVEGGETTTASSIQHEDAELLAPDSDNSISSIRDVIQSLENQKDLPQNVSTGSPSNTLSNSYLKRQQAYPQVRLTQCLTKNETRSLTCRTASFRENFGWAASETYLVSRLSFTLLKYLGSVHRPVLCESFRISLHAMRSFVEFSYIFTFYPRSIGYRWMNKLAALALYAVFLMPGFLQVGYCYFMDKRIHHSIVYGPKPRNRLDIYLPENLDSPKPVVTFVTGGAWIIGYKAWGALLGLQLVEKDVIVICIDYRNFPQGTISDMVEDAMQGISFICNNITKFGGDPDRLYLAGQSAGSHIAACALIEQAIREIRVAKGLKLSDEWDSDQAALTWKASQFKGFFGISGCYNLTSLVDHFDRRGLYRSLFLSIMDGEESLPWFSPELRVKNLSANAGANLPPIYLFHGTDDYSIPCGASESFAEVLVSIGAKVTTRFYDGKTHTDIFLQDPMRGGHDALMADILAVVHAEDTEALAKDALLEPRRLVPEFLLQLARSVSPF